MSDPSGDPPVDPLPRLVGRLHAEEDLRVLAERKLDLFLTMAAHLAPRPGSPDLDTVWVEFVAQAARALDLPAHATREPGALIMDWLRTIDPNWLEQTWLADSFGQSKGRMVLQALSDKAEHDDSLWSR